MPSCNRRKFEWQSCNYRRGKDYWHTTVCPQYFGTTTPYWHDWKGKMYLYMQTTQVPLASHYTRALRLPGLQDLRRWERHAKTGMLRLFATGFYT